MGKYNVGFKVPLALGHEQSQVARILLQHKLCPCLASLAARPTYWAPLLVLAVLIVCPIRLLAQIAGTYRVDTKDSHVEIHLFKGGFLSSLGDNHLIMLTHFSGLADLSGNSPWTAQLTGHADSLKVIDPWGNPSERKEVEDTMLGPQQLDVSHFPMIGLHSLSFDPTGEDTTWHLTADVKFHGVTRKENFSLDCNQFGDRLRIRGKKMLKLTDFHIQPYSRAFGAVKVKNEFEVTYDIVLERVQ
ncbi:MAG: YceI family protein [Acidobacteriota bacterium]